MAEGPPASLLSPGDTVLANTLHKKIVWGGSGSGSPATPIPQLLFPAVEASENLPEGALVNLHSIFGLPRLRLACATSPDRRAHAYMVAAAQAGDTVQMEVSGTVRNAGNFTPGDPLFLSDTVPGKATAIAPSAGGRIVQAVGTASSSTDMLVNLDGMPIILGEGETPVKPPAGDAWLTLAYSGPNPPGTAPNTLKPGETRIWWDTETGQCFFVANVGGWYRLVEANPVHPWEPEELPLPEGGLIPDTRWLEEPHLGVEEPGTPPNTLDEGRARLWHHPTTLKTYLVACGGGKYFMVELASP